MDVRVRNMAANWDLTDDEDGKPTLWLRDRMLPTRSYYQLATVLEPLDGGQAVELRTREMASDWDLTDEDGRPVLWVRDRMLPRSSYCQLATVLERLDAVRVVTDPKG